MQETTKVYIADSNYLIREGLKSLINKCEGIEVIGEAQNSDQLLSNVVDASPDVVVIDYCSPFFKVETIVMLFNIFPEVKVLAITDHCDKPIVENALRSGVNGHLMKDCDEVEITDALKALPKGEKFFCGKVLDAIKDDSFAYSDLGCEPISLSGRELEIIKLIAEGMTNKEIGNVLHISTHTVMTHRKNIMNKLGVNNTAGIVIYAVKENIISPNKFLFAN